MSGVMLELAVFGVARLRWVARELPTDGGDHPVAGGAFDGLAHVARSPYLRSIVGYVLCTSCAATFIYLVQVDIVHDAHLTAVERTKLYASIDLWVNVAALVIQLVLAAPLIRRFGPGLVLCALPVLQAIGISMLVAVPTITAVIAVQIAGRAATHGLTRPARELLFTVVNRDDKYRAKNVIDTVGYRLGDTAAIWLGQGLNNLVSGAIVGAAMILVVGWITLATLLGKGFRART
jgi:AAA family ATP:ADP antiporter